MPDYLDIGIEVMTPSQPEAEGMQPERLKSLFGQRMTFHGGIGLQSILPHGTPAEVKETVKHVARAFGKGGGYILAAAHTPPDDVPTENIIAMLETVRDLTYPL
jgi:uroporphyrinogen decarboxylase